MGGTGLALAWRGGGGEVEGGAHGAAAAALRGGVDGGTLAEVFSEACKCSSADISRGSIGRSRSRSFDEDEPGSAPARTAAAMAVAAATAARREDWLTGGTPPGAAATAARREDWLTGGTPPAGPLGIPTPPSPVVTSTASKSQRTAALLASLNRGIASPAGW